MELEYPSNAAESFHAPARPAGRRMKKRPGPKHKRPTPQRVLYTPDRCWRHRDCPRDCPDCRKEAQEEKKVFHLWDARREKHEGVWYAKCADHEAWVPQGEPCPGERQSLIKTIKVWNGMERKRERAARRD